MNNGVARLAGEPIDLVVPRSLAERWGVSNLLHANSNNPQVLTLIGAGALGLCWPRFKVKADTPKYRHDLLDYGAAVLDCLLAKGATMQEIQRYAVQAVSLCVEGLVSGEDVKAAEDFSGPTRDASPSSSSASSAPGTGTQAGSPPSNPTQQPS